MFLWRLTRLRHRLLKDPQTRAYQDLATASLENELSEHLELYEATDAARRFADIARVKASRFSRPADVPQA